MEIYVYGATAHAKMVLDVAEQLEVKVLGCIDKSLLLESVLDYPVALDHTILDGNIYFIAVQNAGLRKRMFEDRPTLEYTSLISPQAVVSKYADIESGTIVFATAVIAADVQVGRQVLIDSGAIIHSNTIIEDFVNIGANVVIGSNVLIGEGAELGAGVVIHNECTIAPYTIVPALTVIEQ